MINVLEMISARISSPELETAKQILGEIFHTRSSNVDGLIQIRLQEGIPTRFCQKDFHICQLLGVREGFISACSDDD
jgi:hypothetical protein